MDDDPTRTLFVRALVGLYPSRWRQRYGHELAAVLAAALGDGTRRPRLALDVALGALDARIHSSLGGGHPAMTEHLRSATSRALYAFVGFVLAGVGFQKMTEDTSFSSAATAHPLVAWSYHLVVVAAVVAGLAVLTGGLPLGLHIARQTFGGRRDLVRYLMAPPGAVLVFVALTMSLFRLFGHRTTNVHSAANVSLFLLIVALGMAAAVVCASSLVAALRRADIPPRLLRFQVVPISALSVAMTLTAVAALVWGLALRSSNPTLFHSDNGLLATALPATWLSTVVAMAVATAIAGQAALRALATLGEGSSTSDG